ncbi:hypothetical protein JCM10212_005006, partial [Sporobolomyces blumeae]
MVVVDQALVKPWLIRHLAPISDADPATLADYVLALLKHDVPDHDLEANCVDQLADFLESREDPRPSSAAAEGDPTHRKRPLEAEPPVQPNKAARPSNSTDGERNPQRHGRAGGGEGGNGQMCRDYHMRGYCARGPSCPFQHDAFATTSPSPAAAAAATFSHGASPFPFFPAFGGAGVPLGPNGVAGGGGFASYPPPPQNPQAAFAMAQQMYGSAAMAHHGRNGFQQSGRGGGGGGGGGLQGPGGRPQARGAGPRNGDNGGGGGAGRPYPPRPFQHPSAGPGPSSSSSSSSHLAPYPDHPAGPPRPYPPGPSHSPRRLDERSSYPPTIPPSSHPSSTSRPPPLFAGSTVPTTRMTKASSTYIKPRSPPPPSETTIVSHQLADNATQQKALLARLDDVASLGGGLGGGPDEKKRVMGELRRLGAEAKALMERKKVVEGEERKKRDEDKEKREREQVVANERDGDEKKDRGEGEGEGQGGADEPLDPKAHLEKLRKEAASLGLLSSPSTYASSNGHRPASTSSSFSSRPPYSRPYQKSYKTTPHPHMTAKSFKLDNRSTNIVIDSIETGQALDDLRTHFEAFGPINDVSFVQDKHEVVVSFASRAIAEK